MTRSPWLRVYGMQLSALIRLGFPTAPRLRSLSLAAHCNSQVHSTKGTPLPLRAVTSCRSMVSGSISLPLPGFFSPFPHGTCSLSVAVEYLALDRGRPGFRQGFSCPAVLRYCVKEAHPFRLRGFHPLRQAFPGLSATDKFSHNSSGHPRAALQPRLKRFRLLRVRSPLLAESQLISVPGLLRWFTSPSLALPPYFIQARSARITPCGLPHSDIRGSQDMCSFPRLFAAYHVLHRLTAP